MPNNANTIAGMEKRTGETVTLLDEAEVVPSGVVRLIELQEDCHESLLSIKLPMGLDLIPTCFEAARRFVPAMLRSVFPAPREATSWRPPRITIRFVPTNSWATLSSTKSNVASENLRVWLKPDSHPMPGKWLRR